MMLDHNVVIMMELFFFRFFFFRINFGSVYHALGDCNFGDKAIVIGVANLVPSGMVIKGIEEGILLLLSTIKNILFLIIDPVDMALIEYGEGENGLFFLRLYGNTLMEFVI